jgi:hypothetical protein
MNTYPLTPGYKTTGTSEEAARAMETTAPTLRSRALAALQERDMTPDEVAAVLGESVLAVRPRCTELVRLGLAEKTGQRRQNASQMSANVLRAKAS